MLGLRCENIVSPQDTEVVDISDRFLKLIEYFTYKISVEYCQSEGYWTTHQDIHYKAPSIRLVGCRSFQGAFRTRMEGGVHSLQLHFDGLGEIATVQ